MGVLDCTEYGVVFLYPWKFRMVTELGTVIVRVIPLSLSILNFNVPLPSIFKPAVIPLHSFPSDALYVLKWSLLGDIHPDENFPMPIS